MPERTFVQEIAGIQNHGDSVFVETDESPKEWTKQMEREFRQLALGEAKGNLTAEQMAQLEALSLVARTPEQSASCG